MRFLKRIIIASASLALIFSLGGCKKKDNNAETTTGQAVESDFWTPEPTTNSTYGKAEMYLYDNVDEVRNFRKIIEIESKDEGTLAFITTSISDATGFAGLDKTEKDIKDNYYLVQAVDRRAKEDIRWSTFLVRKDLKEVLWSDSETNTLHTLEEWRADDKYQVRYKSS